MIRKLKGKGSRFGEYAACMAVSGLALAIPSMAFAQVQDAAGEWSDDAIVVTAIKREVTLQDVPVSVSVTTAETIERSQIRDLQDLQSVVPSLRVNQLQSSANTNFYIRGFGNGANNAGIEPSVGLFVDGIYRSRSASMIADLPDVERVEVLRGPQSTLFGKNASAGVISLVTRKPQFELGGNVEASYGNYDAMVLKGVVTGPLSETVAASLGGSWNKRDGYVRDLGTGNRTHERDRWFLRGQLLFDPGDDLEVRLIGDYGKIDENCCAGINLRPSLATAALVALGGQVNDPDRPFQDIAYNNFDSTNDIENWGISAQVDYDLGNVELTSITAYRRTNAVTNQDSDFTSADLLGRNFQDLAIKTFTQEFRANADISDRLTGLLGVYYFNEKIDQSNLVNWGADARGYANILIQGVSGCAVAAPTCTDISGLEATLSALSGTDLTGQFFGEGQGLTEGYALKNEALSIFAQADFEIADRLTLTGGINYTHDSKKFRTDTSTSDVFASQDFIALGEAAILSQALIGAGVNPADPAAVFEFATNPATAATFQQFTAFAAAGSIDPTVNPLLALRPFQYFPPFRNVPNAVESGKISDSDLSFTANLAYQATDSINLYLRFATGYKAASVNLSRDSRPTAEDLALINAQNIGVANLTAGSRFANPEDSTLYEAGMKAKFGIGSANIAVFKQEIKGFQSNIFTGSGFLLANAGKQSVTGIEFDGVVSPVEPLTLTLSLTYLDGKYNRFPNSGVGDISGSTPPGYSPFSMTAGAQYEHEFANGDRVILRGAYHYEAPFMLVEGLPGLVVRDPVTGAVIDGSAGIAAAKEFKQQIDDVNASITYAMENGLEFSLWGRNLLDDRSILQIFDSPAQSGSISGYLNQPRTYGASVRFKW